jgi:hypothetical protein
MRDLYDWYFHLKKLKIKYKKFYSLLVFFNYRKYQQSISKSISESSEIISYVKDLKRHAEITKNDEIYNGEIRIITNIFKTVKIEYRGYITITMTIDRNHIKVIFTDSNSFQTKEYFQNASIYGSEFHDSVNNLIMDAIKVYYTECIKNV